VRSEIGALGYVRQNGLQRDRTSFRGVGGRPQGVNMSHNPNHAPQRVNPKPWAVPPPQTTSPQPQQQDVPPEGPGGKNRNLGSFIKAPPGGAEDAVQALNHFVASAPSPASSSVGVGFQPPSSLDPSVTTLAALAGFSPDADIREDVATCKARLDATGLRLSGQDNALKTLERSVSALREEYTKISQATDAQSIFRLEACERTISRLEEGFQEFSSRFQRELRATEQSFASFSPHAESESEAIPCKILQDEDEGLKTLDHLNLYLPLHLDKDGDTCMYRKRFDPASSKIETLSFKVQRTKEGTPRVVFI